MKKRIKSFLVVLMSLALILTGILGSGYSKVQASTDQIKVLDGNEFVVKPGEKAQIKLSVISTNFYIYNPSISISTEKDAPFTFSQPKLFIDTLEIKNIGSGGPSDLIFDVTVKDTAQIGNYPVTINFNYFDQLGGDPVNATIAIKLKITEEKVPAQLTINHVVLSSSSKGSNADLVFTVKNEGEVLAKNAYLTLKFEDGIEERYTVKNIKLGDMAKGDTRDLKLPISILPTAKTGKHKITANFTYKNSDGTEEFNPTYDFSINVTDVVSVVKIPKLIIKDISYSNNLKPGDTFNLKVVLENVGGAGAGNVTAAIDASSLSETGIIKNYFMEGIEADDIEKNGEASAYIPLKIAKGSNGGLLPVKLVISYVDSADNTYSFNETVYIDVMATEVKETGKPVLIISNVKQTPTKPVAGDKLEISFDLENKSKYDAKELMVSVDGYSDATFIPVNPDPYQYYDVLKAGDKMRVTIPLIISNQIPEGLNNIKVRIAYNGTESISETIPVKDIKNDADGISKPVLLISNYSTDVEELRAGGTFSLSFDIYNTNSSTAAKNIKVTIKKPVDPNSDVFTLTQGNNSFFINKINPEESVTKTLEMKIKSNASTQTYPITIQLEYEYDGLKPNPETGDVKGIDMSADINLQVVENARPVVDNVYIYSWDGPVMMEQPATLHLDFYNMGRSQLNNVNVTIAGDFRKADGSMYFMGTVAPGGSGYGDFDVIPSVIGPATCIIKVNYEDSNGDPQEYIYEYQTEVMEAGGGGLFPDDGGMPDGGEVFNPGGVAKKEILPLWAFILIQFAILIIFMPITRKIIISVYRARLIKKEQQKY